MAFNLFHSGTNTLSVDLASLLLRVLGAFGIIYGHGLGKFQRIISGDETQFLDPIGIGMENSFYLAFFAEFLCGILLLLGLLTRWATIPLMITMLVVIFAVHWGDPFAKKEIPMLYLAIFSAILLIGPGKFSLDRLIRNRKKTI